MRSWRIANRRRITGVSVPFHLEGVAALPQYRFHLLTSTGGISHTRHCEFDNDDHATLFAEGLLRAAEPQVTSVEAGRTLISCPNSNDGIKGDFADTGVRRFRPFARCRRMDAHHRDALSVRARRE